jgi:hypothetical protein
MHWGVSRAGVFLTKVVSFYANKCQRKGLKSPSMENPGKPAQKSLCKDAAHFANADNNDCLIHSEIP